MFRKLILASAALGLMTPLAVAPRADAGDFGIQVRTGRGYYRDYHGHRGHRYYEPAYYQPAHCYHVYYRHCGHHHWHLYGTYQSHSRAHRVECSLEHDGYEARVVHR
jgi:hypothetical protein